MPVDLGTIIKRKAVIRRVYVLPEPAAGLLCASLMHSQVSSGVGLYLWLLPLTVSIPLGTYSTLSLDISLVSTHAKSPVKGFSLARYCPRLYVRVSPN